MRRHAALFLLSLILCLASLVTPALGATVTVNVFNFMFSTNPPGQPIGEATIHVGDTVHWVWQSGTHSTTSVAGSIEAWDSAIQATPFTFDHTFTHTGVFTYYCRVHGTDNGNGTASGMSGTVTVLAAGPQITSLSPSSTSAGGPSFTLTVNGSGFQSGAVVEWTANGSTTSLTTTFVSAGQLTATVPSTLITVPSTASVSVMQGGQTSNQVTFNVNNPAPILSKISPTSINSGHPGFTLTATGSGFISGAVVHWKVGTTDTPLTTTFVSATKLTAAVPATLVASAGKAAVSVVTPSPGGGTSGSKTFTVLVTTLQLASATLSKDPTTGNFSATVTLHNMGFMMAQNVTITKSSLAAATSTTLPVNIGSIAAGASASGMLTYPATAGTSGQVVTLKVSGTFTGGTFSGSLKVTLP